MERRNWLEEMAEKTLAVQVLETNRYTQKYGLDLFSQAIRAGYTGYQETQGRREFGKVDIVKRWDKDLYLEALYNLF